MKKKLCVLFALLLGGTAAFFSSCAGSGDVDDPIPIEDVVDNGDVTQDCLQDAKWIWCGEQENNMWVNARKEFYLSRVPQTAVAKIAVCDKYYLYINGKEVVLDGSLKRGQTPTTGYIDSVDIAPYLVKGENVIALKAWYWGRQAEGTSTSHTFTEAGGILFGCNVAYRHIVSDDSWKVERDNGYKNGEEVPETKPRLPEYNIYYNAQDGISDEWKQSSFDDFSWKKATVKEEYSESGSSVYGNLVDREIPLFRFGQEEPYTNADRFEEVTFDRKKSYNLTLPKDMMINPCLTVDAKAGAIITIEPDNAILTNNKYTYVCRDGVQSFEFLGWLSGNSMKYTFYASDSAPITVKSLTYRASGYDCDVTGSFTVTGENSDFYNTLFTMCTDTQYICMRDTFMDCPDRERTQWLGDVATQIRQVVYCMDENAYPLFEKGLKQLVGFRKDGAFLTIAPSEEFTELPSQALAGLPAVWDYYLYTGRKEAIDIVYEAYEEYLSLWSFENGMVNIRKANWVQDEWYDADEANIDRFLLENALYYYACSSLEKMSVVLGVTMNAALNERMDAIAANFQTYWTEDGYKTQNKKTPDERVNAIAVLAGLAREDKYDAITQLLTTEYRCGTYFESFVLQALGEMGKTEEMLVRIENRYQNMVESNLKNGVNTIWEYWMMNKGTYNHAWAASPLLALPKYIAGIRPTSAGYETYDIVPDRNAFEGMNVTVPTVIGSIELQATKGRLSLTLPKGGARLVLKGVEQATVEGGTVTKTQDGVVISFEKSGAYEITFR